MGNSFLMADLSRNGTLVIAGPNYSYGKIDSLAIHHLPSRERSPPSSLT